MSKMTWVTETESWSADGVHYPTKTTTVEIDTEEVTWADLLNEFFHYCNASGYIIDATVIPEMVSACEDIHLKRFCEKYKTVTTKENNDAYF